MKNLAKYVRQQQAASTTIEDRFIAEIDKYLLERKSAPTRQLPRREPERERKCFSSTTYYKCPRSVFYMLHNVERERPLTAQAIRRMGVGTAIHSYIQDILMDMSELGYGIKVVPLEEIPTYKKEKIILGRGQGNHPIETTFCDYSYTEEIPIITMCDGVLEFESKYMVFEFKTINTDDFKLLIRPLPDHIKQGALYYVLTKIPRVMFLYIDKNTQELKAFLQEYNEAQGEWVINRIRYVERHIKANKLPDKEVGDGCKWCDYKKACDNNFMPENDLDG